MMARPVGTDIGDDLGDGPIQRARRLDACRRGDPAVPRAHDETLVGREHAKRQPVTVHAGSLASASTIGPSEGPARWSCAATPADRPVPPAPGRGDADRQCRRASASRRPRCDRSSGESRPPRRAAPPPPTSARRWPSMINLICLAVFWASAVIDRIARAWSAVPRDTCSACVLIPSAAALIWLMPAAWSLIALAGRRDHAMQFTGRR